MTATQNLSADIVPLIALPAINMLAGRLVSLDGNVVVQDGLDVQTGPARFDIIEVIHGRDFASGQMIEVPISRIVDPQIRVKNGTNQWNNLSLERGAIFVLACPPRSGSALCLARGAIAIGAGQGGTVDALRRCYAIEMQKDKPDPERRQVVVPLVAAALQGSQPLLFAYALDFVGRRVAFGRDTGAALLARVIAHAGTLPAARYEIATYMAMQTSLFEPSHKADHANVDVVAAFAAGLVAEPDPERKLAWTRLLGSTLLGELAPRQAEAAALRQALAHAVSAPTAAQVRATLQEVQARSGGADRDTAAELLAIWH